MKAINKGLLKIFSKMGISTLQSYRGAQIFEAIGLNRDRWWTSTSPAPPRASRASDLDVLAREALLKHEFAMQPPRPNPTPNCASGGNYQYRVRGEYHLLNPVTVSKLQHAVRQASYETYPGILPTLVNDQNRQLLHAARPVRLQAGRHARAARRGRARRGDREALRHRRHVLRLHQQGSARDAGHRHEPHRRQVQHRRGRRRRGALHARRQRRPAAQRHQAGGFGALRRHRQLPGERRRAADQDRAGRQARRGRPAARPQGGRGDRPRAPLDPRRAA